MKKKTIITTEKHEVWVISQFLGGTDEIEQDGNVAKAGSNSSTAPNELPPDDDASVDEHE